MSSNCKFTGYYSGKQVVDDPSNKKYPMPLTATKQWNVEVGRIRENDIFGEYGLDLFVCGDQVPYILPNSISI